MNSNTMVTVTGNVTVTTGDRSVPVEIKLGPVPGVPDERVARAVAADIVIAAQEGASQIAATWASGGAPVTAGVLVPNSDPESTVVVVAGIVTVVSAACPSRRRRPDHDGGPAARRPRRDPRSGDRHRSRPRRRLRPARDRGSPVTAPLLACPVCGGPQLAAHPAGLLAIQHTNTCRLRAAEDSTQVADLDRLSWFGANDFDRPPTAAERELLTALGQTTPDDLLVHVAPVVGCLRTRTPFPPAPLQHYTPPTTPEDVTA
jgi:hypothetical protein